MWAQSVFYENCALPGIVYSSANEYWVCQAIYCNDWKHHLPNLIYYMKHMQNRTNKSPCRVVSSNEILKRPVVYFGNVVEQEERNVYREVNYIHYYVLLLMKMPLVGVL